MFCTTISGLPGMCLPRYCATKRPQSSWAPPTEFPTMSLIDLLLKNSSEAACARLERRANPIKKDMQLKILFMRPPPSSQCVERSDAAWLKSIGRHLIKPPTWCQANIADSSDTCEY